MGISHHMVSGAAGLYITEVLPDGDIETAHYTYDGQREVIGKYRTPSLETINWEHRKTYFKEQRDKRGVT